MSDTTTTTPAPRLKAQYDDEIRSALKEQLGLDNVMQVPRLEKIRRPSISSERFDD